MAIFIYKVELQFTTPPFCSKSIIIMLVSLNQVYFHCSFLTEIDTNLVYLHGLLW